MKFNEFMKDVIISEGVYDPYIFKAVFMAGGPGSGKSHVGRAMFSGLGLKELNSDVVFEKYIKSANMALNDIDLVKYPQQRDLRDKAKAVKDKQAVLYREGMLGLLIDGTGHSFDRIHSESDTLKKLGYDTFLVFVNTSLDVSKERNQRRERKLQDMDLITQRWQAVQYNIGAFQEYFGSQNMLIVDNNKDRGAEDSHEFELKLRRAALNMLNKPLQNHIGRERIQAIMQPSPIDPANNYLAAR